MNYYTIVNSNKTPSRFFAKTEERAIELACAMGHNRKPNRAKVTQVVAVCPVCCPHEGRASYELAGANPGWQAWNPFTKTLNRQSSTARSLSLADHQGCA